MTWQVFEEEFEGVLKAGAPKQYDYFIGHVTDHEEIWGLAVDGTDWAQVEDDDGVTSFAMWPHPRFAEACRKNHWEHREPTPLDVYNVIDELIPKLIDEGTGVAVFPLPDGRFTPVSPRKLRSDLEGALAQYE